MSALAVGVVLGQLVGLSPAGYKGTLSVGDRSEVRVHSNVNASESFDLETIPTAVMSFTGRRSSFSFGYGPRFAWIDVNRDPVFVIMNTGRFSASAWSKRVRWTLSVTGSIGRQTAAGLGITIPLASLEGATPLPGQGAAQPPATPGGTPAPAPPPGAVAQPQQPIVTYYLPPSYPLYTGSLRASLSVSDTFSPRWVGSLTGFYQMSGGLGVDYFSQLAYPPNRGGGGEAVLTYNLSRRDSILSRLYGEYTYVWFTTKDQFFVTTYTESLRHSFSKRTVGTVGAGVSMVVRKLARQDALSGAVAGAGEASITHTTPLRGRGRGDLTTRAAANLNQAYNPFLATIQWQAFATLSAVWTRDPVSVAVATTAATTLNESSDVRAATGSVTLGYALAEPVVLQTGVRAYAQLLPSSVDATYPPQWVAFVALLLAAPPAKL